MQYPHASARFDCILVELETGLFSEQTSDQTDAKIFVTECLAQALLQLDDPQTEAWTVEVLDDASTTKFALRPLSFDPENGEISISSAWRLSKELCKQAGIKSALIQLRH